MLQLENQLQGSGGAPGRIKCELWDINARAIAPCASMSSCVAPAPLPEQVQKKGRKKQKKNNQPPHDQNPFVCWLCKNLFFFSEKLFFFPPSPAADRNCWHWYGFLCVSPEVRGSCCQVSCLFPSQRGAGGTPGRSWGAMRRAASLGPWCALARAGTVPFVWRWDKPGTWSA